MRITILTLLAFALSLPCLPAQATRHTVLEFVWSSRGFLMGDSDGKVDRFLGVPYAAAPVGSLRWKAPADPPRWSGIRDATSFGSQCVQVRTGSSTISGSEDCLYLNIYRPANARPRNLLPVMIFIHGGSNQDGAGSDYDPSALVSNGLIVVTINYRLNVFGFLALPSLDTDSGEPVSGNFGFLDQQAAMRWVRDNILTFGGNPFDVTVGGESAGAIDICAQLTSPGAAGLFHRVILESFYCPSVTHDQAVQTSAPIATALNCNDPATVATCLRAKPAADVLNAAGDLSLQPGGGPGFNASPNYGNSILPLQPAAAISAAKWNWSTILLGSNHDDAALFTAPLLTALKIPLPLSVQAYQLLAQAQFGTFAPAVLKEYPLAQYSDPFLAYSDEWTDYSPLGCPLTPLSQSMAALTQTFRYEFDDATAPTPGASSAAGVSLGAYHGSELQYLFQVTLFPGSKTPAQQQLSNQMIQYWANFIKTGNPNGPGLPEWPRYDAAAHQILSLRLAGSTVIDNFDTDHHCAFWATAPGPPFHK